MCKPVIGLHVDLSESSQQARRRTARDWAAAALIVDGGAGLVEARGIGQASFTLGFWYAQYLFRVRRVPCPTHVSVRGLSFSFSGGVVQPSSV